MMPFLLLLLAQSAGFEKLAADAESAFAAKRADAPALFAKALRSNPKWKEGWWRLGSLQYQADDWKNCRDSFRKLAELDPQSGTAWSMLGLCEFSAGEGDHAAEHLRRGIDLGVSGSIDTIAKVQLAKQYARSGNFEPALEIYANLAQTGKESPAIVTASGLAALWKPMLPEQVPEADRELVYLAGRAFWDAVARNVPAALVSFETLLARYPEAPGVHYLRGTFGILLSSDQAIPDFEAELKINPGHVGAIGAIAAEYLRRVQPEQAMPWAKLLLEKAPESAGAHAIYGRVLAETGDLKQAMVELELATRLAPGDARTHFALSGIYAKLGRPADAERERRESIRLSASEKKANER